MFEPYEERKIWGSVLHVFSSDHASVSCLQVEADYRCSCHHHQYRANQFVLLDGCICIEQWNQGLALPSRIKILQPGNTHIVPSLIWHRFRVIASGRLIEVYWADAGGTVSMDDIVRNDEGGKDDFDGLKELLARGQNDS